MAYTYRIDNDLGIIYYLGIGYCTAKELLEAESAVSRDPKRQAYMKIILDLSRAEMDISLNDIYEGLSMNRKRLDKGDELEETAILYRNRFAQVLGETFRLLGDGLSLKFGIFTTLSDALNWLGLSDQEERIEQIEAELLLELKG